MTLEKGKKVLVDIMESEWLLSLIARAQRVPCLNCTLQIFAAGPARPGPAGHLRNRLKTVDFASLFWGVWGGKIVPQNSTLNAELASESCARAFFG